MKRVAILIALLATVALGQDQPHQPPKTIDTVFLVPNGFKGPIFVDQGRVVLPEVIARQQNTWEMIVVDEGGEAVQIGTYDLVSGWSYPYSVVQRNGLTIKAPATGTTITDDDIAFRVIGGYGPGNRAYRPGGFGAFFIGTKAQADAFQAQLERLIKTPAPGKDRPKQNP